VDELTWDERYPISDLIWTEPPDEFLVRETVDLAPGRVLDIADGGEVRRRGEVGLVDRDPAPRTELEPGRAGERDVRAHANGTDDHVGWEGVRPSDRTMASGVISTTEAPAST